MKLLLSGVNHRSAPLALRERFAVDEPGPWLEKLLRDGTLEEAVLLSTCNRSEVFALVEDGERVYATFDDRQVGDTRLSSVQYLKFATGGRTPVAVGCDHDDLDGETELSEDQRGALRADLEG